MIIKVIKDKFNSDKFWLISKAKSGHYTLTQKVYGDVTGKERMGLAKIKATLDWAEI